MEQAWQSHSKSGKLHQEEVCPSFLPYHGAGWAEQDTPDHVSVWSQTLSTPRPLPLVPASEKTLSSPTYELALGTSLLCAPKERVGPGIEAGSGILRSQSPCDALHSMVVPT